MRGGKREKETGESGERGNGETVNIFLGSNSRTVSYKKLKKFMSPFFLLLLLFKRNTFKLLNVPLISFVSSIPKCPLHLHKDTRAKCLHYTEYSSKLCPMFRVAWNRILTLVMNGDVAVEVLCSSAGPRRRAGRIRGQVLWPSSPCPLLSGVVF